MNAGSCDSPPAAKFKLLFALAAMATLALISWLTPFAEWAVWLAERLRASGPAGIGIFFLAYVLAAIVMFPAWILTVVAGFIYGPVKGTLLASPASVLAATAAFLLARGVLRRWAQAVVARDPKIRALDLALARHSFKLVLLLRLSPLAPFNLLNYLLGLSGMSLRRYVLASAIGMLPGTFLYVYLGSLVTAPSEFGLTRQDGASARTALYFGGLAATMAVVLIVTREARNILRREIE